MVGCTNLLTYFIFHLPSGARKLLKMFGESKRCVKQFYIDLRDPVDMYASLWPLMLISFFSGISPFKCAGPPGNRHLETTFIGVANTVFHLVWYCTCYALRVINDKSLQAHLFNSKVSRFGEYIQIVTSFMALGFTLILCFLKRDKLRKLLHALTQIDRELIGLGANINYKTISQFVQVALLVQWLLKFAFLGATFFVMRKLENPPDFFEWAFFFLPFFILATLKLQFICLSQLIRNRLNYVNIVLNTLQLRERNRSSARGSLDGIDGSKGTRITCDVVKLTGGADSKRKNSDIIGALCRAHEEICDACDLAEQYFSHQMLTTVTIEFVVSLFNCYLMLDVAYNKSQVPGMDTTEFYAYFTFYTLISMGTVYGLLRSAETVTNQVSSIGMEVPAFLNFRLISERKVCDQRPQIIECT